MAHCSHLLSLSHLQHIHPAGLMHLTQCFNIPHRIKVIKDTFSASVTKRTDSVMTEIYLVTKRMASHFKAIAQQKDI